jgi:hypothetical protein
MRSTDEERAVSAVAFALGSTSVDHMRHAALVTGLAVLVAGVLLAMPASSGATSVIYIDAGNIWTARVDGTHKQRFTTNGTTTTPPFNASSPKLAFVGPYSNVTADDRGQVLAARQFRDQKGANDSPFWLWDDAAGKQLKPPALVKMTFCGFYPVGPMGARLHPSGKWFAFWYICEFGAPSWSSDEYVQVNSPGSIVQGPEWSGMWQPSWYGWRLTASNLADGGIQADDPSAPLVIKSSFDLWIEHVGDDRISQVEPARAGGRAIVEHYDSSAATAEDKLTFVMFTGAPRLGGTTDGCTIPTAGDASSPSWSADGMWVGWSDKGGVKTSRIPANLATPGPCQMSPRVIASTGNQSSLTPYDWWPAARVTPSLPRSASSTTLRRGLAITVRVTRPGRLTLVARDRGAVVATGAKYLRQDGRATITLTLVGSARRHPDRLRGRTLSVRFTLTTPGATAAGAAGTLKVR